MNQTGINPETELINNTFYQLLVNFPAWKNSVDNTVPNGVQLLKDNYRRELKAAMIEAGINSDAMIQVGIRRARASGKPFLPAPGEFCEWCKPTPEDCGLPGVEKAFQEARIEVGKGQKIRKWSHVAVYLAAQNTSIYDLKRILNNDKIYKDVKSRFTEEYGKLVKRVMAGEELTTAPEHRIERKPPPGKTKRSEAVASNAMSNIMGLFND